MEFVNDLRASRVHGRAFAVQGMCVGAFAAYAPQLKAHAGLGDAEFGLALLVGAMGAVLAMWLAPRMDRVLGMRAMQVCALLMAAAFILPGVAMNWPAFAAAAFLGAGASGLLDVVMNSRLSALEARSGRSLMNLNHGLFSLAYAVSALGAGVLREAGVGPVACFAGLVGLTGLLALGMRDPTPPLAEPEGDAPPAAVPVAMIGLAGGIVLIAFTAEQATENWSALHLERAFGASAAAGALGPAILGLTMAFGRLCGQLLIQRVAEGWLMQIAAILAAFGLALAALAPVQGLAYAGFAILGLGVSVIGPTALAWVGKTLPDAMRPAAISRMVMIGYCGFFVGPPVIGVLAEAFGLRAALTVMAGAVLLIALVLVPALRATARRGRALA
ncbi:MFS transporter [Phaeobacter sp. HF9A]|uniref:MFS transporter n=1 Tax=Phaeobacter sp. HF9A TaxID=2721561 RepID=UPI0014311EDA|nr:MFS transporter [Phaeobacter sp. HF9A]NIZ14767.1 MFS transporter [Phaeobacter sp. HF9A]